MRNISDCNLTTEKPARFRVPLVPLVFSFALLSACAPAAGEPLPSPSGLTGPYSDPASVSATTDPAYAGISYSQSKFVPPDGTFLLIGGQDVSNISQIPSAWSLTPGGFAHYFSVSDSNGIWSSYNYYGDAWNLQNAKWIADTHPNAVLQMAMWMVGVNKGWGNYPANVTNHLYDAYYQSFCDFAKSYNQPIFLRIGYEFDGPHNALLPGEYVAAYRYIVDFIRADGVTNVAFVWHSWNNYTYNSYPITNWYPGDSYVDWFGMSVFRDHLLDGVTNAYLEAFVDLAKAHSKPVMISESCPSPGGGGITNNNYETWNRWFVHYFNYIIRKNIKAFSYINCDWEKISQFAGQGWANTRLQDYPLILAQWKTEVGKSRYLKESTNLFRILGYTN